MVQQSIGTSNGVSSSFGPPACRASQLDSLPRRDLSLQALQRTEPVARLAAHHEVSRKFVYQQMAKATTAIDRAFQAPGSPEDKVLFQLPVTQSWLEQLVLSLALYCHSPLRGTMELLDTMFEYRDLSLGSLSHLFQRAVDKVRQFHTTEDLFAIQVATRKVEILGVDAQPDGPWMEQIARNISGEGGFLTGKKYLIHDRDPLYTDKFDSILKAAGVEPVKLPPRSPNLNPHAERFVRSVKEECLNLLILSSEEQLRYVLGEYLQYYHHERIHQGLHKIIEPQHEGHQGEIICIERLGGLLKSYHRKAA